MRWDTNGLSGGEKQCIALARAMLQKPQILILGEASSALDIENETRIRDTIDKLQNEMTVIVIGHRLPTLENADQLIILDGGQVQSDMHGRSTERQDNR
ncbi:MAG: ATP-binding cassette domain-containing protein [Parasphingorhabdus sp.]|uniref:ATP-binding cassette domain-containing protein n=1 Tax=Parasphingorhabdus sp. TaxID=2709688 RepID=UPI0032652526